MEYIGISRNAKHVVDAGRVQIVLRISQLKKFKKKAREYKVYILQTRTYIFVYKTNATKSHDCSVAATRFTLYRRLVGNTLVVKYINDRIYKAIVYMYMKIQCKEQNK